jgi:beta-aspartyl-peptidase (threonine type)
MAEGWAILVHGGAKTIPPARQVANRAGCLRAVEAGQAVLQAGGAAIDAVVAAIQVLEDDPTFNAGAGAVRNAEGEVELDAALMDGEHLDVGAVAAVRDVRNPIALCRAMLMDRPVLVVGDGAARYARKQGIAFRDGEGRTAVQRTADEVCDTVGCVALDAHGHFAAGTSTGGLEGTCPGRVGDSPLPGCGLYADDAVGAVSFSGDGESIVRLALAGRLMADLREIGASDAAARSIGHLPRVGGEAGCIVIDGHGQVGFAHNSDHFAVALATNERPAQAYLHQDEKAP